MHLSHQPRCKWLAATMTQTVTPAWFGLLWTCWSPSASLWRGSTAEPRSVARHIWTWDLKDLSPLQRSPCPVLSTSPSTVRSFLHLSHNSHISSRSVRWADDVQSKTIKSPLFATGLGYIGIISAIMHKSLFLLLSGPKKRWGIIGPLKNEKNVLEPTQTLEVCSKSHCCVLNTWAKFTRNMWNRRVLYNEHMSMSTMKWHIYLLDS